MEIIELTSADSVTEAVVAAFERLIPQLSSSNPPPSREMLIAMAESEASHLLMAVEDGAYCGSLTLATFRIPTGLRAWIEDVVVDDQARGKGVGEALNRHALQLAAELGCTTVDLTSRPTREAANRLYQRLGFKARETNVYRYSL